MAIPCSFITRQQTFAYSISQFPSTERKIICPSASLTQPQLKNFWTSQITKPLPRLPPSHSVKLLGSIPITG